MEMFIAVLAIVLYAINEILPFVKSTKANGILHAISLIGKPVVDAAKNAVVEKKESEEVAVDPAE